MRVMSTPAMSASEKLTPLISQPVMSQWVRTATEGSFSELQPEV